MKRDMWFLLVILSALAVVFLIRGFGGKAATPGVFSDGYTLEQAAAKSLETGKPIFAVATADWCPPCQSLKRGALMDPDIVAYLREHTIPVYLEESVSMQDIRALPVRAYPTSVVLNRGEVFAVIEGQSSAEEYLRLIQDAVADAG